MDISPQITRPSRQRGCFGAATSFSRSDASRSRRAPPARPTLFFSGSSVHSRLCNCLFQNTTYRTFNPVSFFFFSANVLSFTFSWRLHQKSTKHRRVGLFLDSRLCSIELTSVLSTVPSWWLQLCHEFWNRDEWALQLCSPAGLVLRFWVPWISKRVSEACQFLQRSHLGFRWALRWICRWLWVSIAVLKIFRLLSSLIWDLFPLI